MKRWSIIAAAAAALAMLMPGAHRAVEAQPPTIEAREVRGQPVVVNGRELRLWVFIHPERNGRDARSSTASYCTDGDQSTSVPKFAQAKPSGMTFNINAASIPGYLNQTAAIQAIQSSFASWDAVSTSGTYFTVNGSGGASGPAFDGKNTVGWAYIVPTSVIAATWVWTDANNNIVEADVFNNAFLKWGTFTDCNAQNAYAVQNIDTHEAGHTVGLDHLADPNGFATMYPTASKGEVRKQTLTTGDKNGYTAAGGY